MFKIIIEKECGCFKRSDMENGMTMDSKDGALLQAIQMKDTMNDDFCGKHEFKVQEVQDNFVIAFSESTSNGCCGGGCSTH